MERVGTLLQKLQEQFAQRAGAAQLLLTVGQLQAELHHLQQQEGQAPTPGLLGGRVAVDIPSMAPMAGMAAQQNDDAGVVDNQAMQAVTPDAEAPAAPPAIVAATPPETPVAEEKIVEVLQVDEAELEAELEEIKRNAAAKNNMSVHYKPISLADDPAEVPTLIHQQPPAKELNDAIVASTAPSLNDRLKQSTMELGDHLAEPPIGDLRKAIGINDRYLFVNELFRGDETMYERSIKTINGFAILPEAEYWIQRELKVKLGWSDANETVQQFNQLVKRRFS
jgi:hypothetical protein